MEVVKNMLFSKVLPIDQHTQKSKALNLISFSRPYMRAFHFSWLGFCTAFTGWFAIPPLLEAIRPDLGLTSDQEANTQIAAVSSTIFFRVLVGLVADKVGPKKVMGMLLIIGAIPIGLSGLVNNYEGLLSVRFFIGILGATFVPCQLWTSNMFHKNVVGSANALAGGWGNMGGGLTYILMPLVYEGLLDRGLTLHMAWRVAMVIPACLCLIVGISCFLFIDDCPQGKWENHVFQVEDSSNDVKNNADSLETLTVTVKDINTKAEEKITAELDVEEKRGKQEKIVKKSFREGAIIALKNYNVWVLMIMYACSFGVELAVDNVLGIFFAKQFGLPLKKASLISSLFGLMNLFSRASGGFLSDYGYYKMGIRGRLLVQFIILLLEGAFLFTFRYSLGSLDTAIVVLILFSYFVQVRIFTYNLRINK